MLKKWYKWIISISLLLVLSCSALWYWAERYTQSNTIPAHVQLSGWLISGMDIPAFEQELAERIRKLEQRPIVFSFDAAKLPPIRTTPADMGVRYQATALMEQLKQLQHGSLWKRVRERLYFQKQWSLTFDWEQSIWKNRFTPQWEIKAFGNPVSAERIITANDTIEYKADKPVYRLDRVQLEQTIQAALPAQWTITHPVIVAAPLQRYEAPVTLRSLQAEGIERKIMEFSTTFVQDDDGRTHNVKAAAHTINNMLLKPGDIFDYDRVIADTERQHGFKEAPVIFNGKLVPGVGGGICQVSSTLYNAALRSGLHIVERRNHSLPVKYLPLGLDATFSQGYINFKFKNTTAKHLLIRTTTEGDRLTIKLFGTMDTNIQYKMETKTIKIMKPDVKYVRNNQLTPGTQELLQPGKNGFQVETYRLKLVDGKEVSRERVSLDTYKPQPSLIAVNNGGTPERGTVEERKPIVEDGLHGPNFDHGR
ncbi:VanW family protein [Paenibacillus sp. SC116]|uniref:VanW family protein n=1 Tax=Paenibacillus sp. SC116 TaxID=2968986 RepID=UPI00215AE9C5|nr:VanW family protein [Paenibacillus sp. SC116]MCR8844828.1 VanW family protein [Paenibacillus sp. SC116]